MCDHSAIHLQKIFFLRSIAEIGEWVQRKMREERDIERHELRRLRGCYPVIAHLEGIRGATERPSPAPQH